jgi:hypothetical protein
MTSKRAMLDLAVFVCPRCGARSYNPHDIEFRYCGRCRAFIDIDTATERAMSEGGSIGTKK